MGRACCANQVIDIVDDFELALFMDVSVALCESWSFVHDRDF